MERADLPLGPQSLTDRTLDQMCTVTRPGIASIASSTAVELMVSILQHPKGYVGLPPRSQSRPLINALAYSALAPSDIPLANASAPQTHSAAADVDPSLSSPLGIVPHQIRGFLAQFNNLKITGQAYDRCTGCSDTVRFFLSAACSAAATTRGLTTRLTPPLEQIVSAYENEGFEMLVQAFGDAKYLERLTGLDKMEEETAALMESLDWSGSEEEEEEEDSM